MSDRNPPQERRVRRLLQWATAQLRTCLAEAPAGSAETPYLDSLLLLAFASGETTERLMASMPDELPTDSVERFFELVEQRCTGMPISYIRGTKEFYGRDFAVSPAVLVPRPDTEILVETALEIIDTSTGDRPHVHDTCTGSGCVAITIAAERRSVTVTASDISPDALAIARRNSSALLSTPLEGLWKSDLLQDIEPNCSDLGLPRPGIITANPPYLTDTEYRVIQDSGWPEPEQALRAGADGLDLIRRLAGQAVTVLPSGGYLVLEIGASQGLLAAAVLEKCGFSEIDARRDLAGRDRVMVARKRN
ncbi:MAG TPA: peptide chain release factor N(5)-glutamine methyltransferase [Spirochaetia bacterium]|nr:peptide chain release factor N(5)-glutamine methyltransferase [Spirochaetia bacterium]